MKRKNVIIMGAAGRDFYNFNTYFKDNEDYLEYASHKLARNRSINIK